MKEGIVKMRAGSYLEALRAFNFVTKEAPDDSESWKKRATVYCLMNNYEKPI